MFCGSGELENWGSTIMFDGMGALSSKYNDTPETASRAYDASRDGFVIAGGGGMVVLEELEHAKARGARIYAEVVGYGATSDGHDMVAPNGEGAARCMRWAVWLQLQHLLLPGVLLANARRRLRDLELFGFRHASEMRRESARKLRSMSSFFD